MKTANGLLRQQCSHLVVAVLLPLLFVLSGLAGCGGGGGGEGTPPPPANVAGSWTVTETGTSNSCGEPVDRPYQISIAQNGSSITVTTPVGVFAGSLNGSVLSWAGSYPEDGGTTNIGSLTATVSGDSFSGTSNWTWTGPGGSCSGSTTFSGARTSQPPATFSIGGSISGLTGTVVLQNHGGNNLSRSINGSFSFASPVSSGSSYNVTVLTQPDGQICSVSNGNGTASANVANIAVTCSATTFTLSVNTTGSGSVSRNPSQSSYAAGSSVTLTASAQPGNAFSFWSGGLTGSQNPATVTINSNLTINANFVAAGNTLTVVKSGLGSGTVTGTGINCGPDCSESAVTGSVVLTATAATGSTFGPWTGCDSVSTNQCTVNMTSSRTVTATFNQTLTVSAPTVDVPATDADGTYNVTVNCSGLCSSTFFFQEATNTAFTSPTQVTHINVNYPRVVPITGKAAGTYCYRAAASVPNWGNVECLTVSTPTTGVFRILNNSSYDLIDVRLNGVQQASYPNAILAGGGSFDFVRTPGTVTYNLGNGFYDSDTSRNIWFTLSGSATVQAGVTTTVTFNNPAIGELLSGFTTARNWDGMYFDSNINSFFKRYRFTRSTNGWQLFDSTAPCFGGNTCTFHQVGSGTVTLASWPKYSPIVTFRFTPTGTPVSIAFPFSLFQQQNGPDSWRIIEYVIQ